jgi:hypothetical protein
MLYRGKGGNVENDRIEPASHKPGEHLERTVVEQGGEDEDKGSRRKAQGRDGGGIPIAETFRDPGFRETIQKTPHVKEAASRRQPFENASVFDESHSVAFSQDGEGNGSRGPGAPVET